MKSHSGIFGLLTRAPRVDFDELRSSWQQKIDKMSLNEIATTRKLFTETLEKIHLNLKEQNIKDGRRRFLRGQRKIYTQLCSYTKERIRLIHLVVCNGTSESLARKFLKVAADELPIEIFQRIYGLALTDEDIKSSKIEEVRKFLEEAKEGVEICEPPIKRCGNCVHFHSPRGQGPCGIRLQRVKGNDKPCIYFWEKGVLKEMKKI
ncbi:MAG: hypothetical protein E3J56_12660 [Candidatus Aminicenantes bacterium]|nr:MAG: hypothetical protein E3J56_12660 [Candidatus Aminicenantes bacterium]